MLDSEVQVGMIFKGYNGTFELLKLKEDGPQWTARLQFKERNQQITCILISNYGLLDPTLYQVIYPDVQIKEIDWI